MRGLILFRYPTLALLPLLALASGCEDTSLREIHPHILVCATAETDDADCNRPLDLGEQPMAVAFEFSLELRNSGDAPLNISAIESDAPALQPALETLRVEAGQRELLQLTLTPGALGADLASLRFDSDDGPRTPLDIPVRWQGLPVPLPDIELCSAGDGTERCGVDLVLDFGSVRRSQRESRTVTVHNRGTASLAILNVSVQDESSQAGELRVATSTRAGELGPGDQAEIVIIYSPEDSLDDSLVLSFESDDPDNPVARVTAHGSSVVNLPPVADARQQDSGATAFSAAVGEQVVLDGSGSLDPEGDPLHYLWSLLAPDQSQTELDDAEAGRVAFVPDRAGSYRVELVVYDSLEQRSEVAAVVLISARPRHALRAEASWPSGADVDLHLVRNASELFTPLGCSFASPSPDWGVSGEGDDDPLLLADSVVAPGHEEILLVAPVPGSYRLYVHYYDDAGTGPATVALRVVINDASYPALQETRSLPAACAIWYVGEARFPEAVFNASGAAVEQQCP